MSYKQLEDRFVLTFENVPEWDKPENLNSFQTELFFDGVIRLTYLGVHLDWQYEECPYYVGLSKGTGIPDDFVETDFSDYTNLGRIENATTHMLYETIQGAINAAQNGDEIVVYPGTYNESINFNGKNITVQGMDSQDWSIVEQTIIDGNGATNTVQMGAGANHPILTGVTVTGGVRGVYCNGSSQIDVNHCIMTCNSDAGVLVYGANAIIANCIIENNNNRGVFIGSASGTITNSIIIDNETGIFIDLYATGNVFNCTIVNNDNYGILRTLPYSGSTIKNCILWDNGGDLNGCSATYSCIEDNDSEPSNIHDAPCFVEPENNNYHLTYNSPCIDVGNNAAVNSGDKDIDDDDRIIVGGSVPNAIVDMGADEYNPN